MEVFTVEKILLRRRHCCFVLLMICLLCGGCFQCEMGLTIRDDGAVDMSVGMIGVPMLAEPIEEAKNNMVSNTDAHVERIGNGNMSGYSISLKYETIEELAQGDKAFFAARKNVSKGIQQHKSWFYDAYSFDLLQEGRGEPPTDPMTRAMAAQVIFDFVVNLPYAADENNADSVVNENKNLTWNLAPTLTNGEDKRIQLTFKLWHKDKIALTAALIVALLGASIFFFKKSSSNADADERNAASSKAKAFLGMAAVVIAASAYMLIKPVEFTDDEIISGTLGMQTNNLGTQLNDAVEPTRNEPVEIEQRPTPSNSKLEPTPEPKSEPTPVNADEQDARRAFINYHNNITHQNYSGAYEALTEAQQQRVGDLKSYSAGYVDTISSSVDDLTLVSSADNSFTFNYRLVARDRYQGGKVKVQTFDGQVTLVKRDGRWMIDEARSKKIDEWIDG